MNANDSNQRLDKFLTKTFKALPTSMLYKAVRLKKIKVNNKKSTISYKLMEGDVLTIYLNDDLLISVKNDEFYRTLTPNIDILYEDENILLVDKAPGMICHSDSSESYNTLINHIISYLYRKAEYNPVKENSFTPALVNRIDRNTGGIVIAAKNASTLRILSEKIKNHELCKKYLCIADGIFDEKEAKVTSYLEKDSKKNMVFVHKKPNHKTKTAILKYRVLKENGICSLVEVELLTGRTHQIRVQLADIGHPLAGDGKYSTNEINKKYNLHHQALYSYKLKFCFKTTAFELDYLNNQEFTVTKSIFDGLI
ncbi:MAG: RluA family pseudouridine synthase [Clostridia bacterium]